MMRKFLTLLFALALSVAVFAGGPAEAVKARGEYVPTGTSYETDGVYFRDTQSQRIGLVISNFEGMAIQSKLTKKDDAPATATTDIFGMKLNVDYQSQNLADKALVFDYETFVNAALYFTIIINDNQNNEFTIKAKSVAYRMNDQGVITNDGLNTIEYKINNVNAGWMGQQNPVVRFRTVYIVPFTSFVCNANPEATLEHIKSIRFVYSFGAASTYQLKAVIGTLKVADFTVDGTNYTLSNQQETIFDPVREDGRAAEGADFEYYTSVNNAEPKQYFDIAPLAENEWEFRNITVHESSAVDVLFPAELKNENGFIDISGLDGMLITVNNLTAQNVGFRLAIWDGDEVKWSALRTGASLAIPDGASPENNYSDIYWRRTGNIPANFKGKILIPFSATQQNPVFSGGTTQFPNLCSKTYNAVRMYFTNEENANARLAVDKIEFITNLRDYVSTVYITAENGEVTTDKISYEGMIAVKTGEQISLQLAPELGYELKSITINDEEQDVANTNFTYTVNEDIHIVALFDLKQYRITYHLNGGTNDPDNPDTYTIVTKTITLNDPVKEGDTFLGWYLNSDFSGEEVTSIPRGSTGDIELYAKWKSMEKAGAKKGCKGAASVASVVALLVPALFIFKKK
ncbi:MAG TPA: InlB B-repeat-containing protein [Clostridia bacterium]